MKDIILCDGDLVMFEPTFGPAIVTMTGPVKITGSGLAKIGGKNICVMGDHLTVSGDCTYINGAFTTPGTGKLTIVSLLPPQMLPTISAGNKPMMVKGQKFIALFTRLSPALNTTGPSPLPDVTPMLPGNGMFMPSQFQVTGG